MATAEHDARAQALYQGLVEQLPAFTYIDVEDDRASDGCRTIYASPQIEDMLGYTPEEFIDDLELWGTMLHPDDRERQLAEDAHLWETGEPYVSEYRLFARDGRVVWVRNHAVLVRGESDPLTVAQGVLYDITESKHVEEALRTSETRFRSLLEHGPEGVLSVDTDGSIILANAQSERLFGYGPGELVGRPVEDLVPESRRGGHEAHRHRYEADPATRPRGHGLELSGRRRDGTVFPVEISLSSLPDEDRGSIVVAFVRDVTERKRAEEALAEAEARYRGVFENATEAIFVTTLDGRYLLANPALAEMLGYSSPEELIDRVIDVGRLYSDQGWREEFLRRLDREDTLRGFEYEVTRRDGSTIWVSENVRAVRDSNGRLIGSEGMSTDITARKHAEQALTESEERFRQLSEAAFECVVVVDTGGHVMQANRAFCEMFDLSLDEAIGSSPLDVVAPESLPRAYEYLRSGSETPVDIEVVRKDGSHLVLEATLRRIEHEGQEARLITMRDVTERRAIEDLLRRRDAVLGAVAFAAERFLDGPWEADIDGVLARLGEATDSSRVCLFRNEPGDDGTPLMTLTYEWAAPGVPTTIQDPANARFPYQGDYAPWIGELGAGHIIQGSRPDFPEVLARDLEEENVVSVALVPVFAGGEWWGYLSFDDCVDGRVWSGQELELLQTAAGILGGAIARTNAELALGRINAELEERVTERTAEVVVAMQEAERAKESAERASRAKSEFLSRASHELRTPLNAILGFGQLLEGSALPEEDSESVEEIVKAGRHLLELVNEVLDISRLDAGRLGLSIEPVSVEAVVGWALDLIAPQARGRGIELRTEIPPEDIHVMADVQRLEQVLLNLLSNAVKFDREEGTVTISCDASEEHVTLRVADTGQGIAPERLDRLFTPFDRLGAETTGGAGTGLGLALSKALVEAMGGRITVETTLDVGATFAVELRRAAVPVLDGRLPIA